MKFPSIPGFSLVTAMSFALSWGADVYIRPYIDGDEVVGATLQRKYSTPESNEGVLPFTRWECSESRTGKPVAIKEGKEADSYTLTAADAGKYFRFVLKDGEEAVESPWIGPVMTADQAASIYSCFDGKKSYEDNVAAMQAELDKRLADAVYFTVDSGALHGSPHTMIFNERVSLEKQIRPFITNGQIYLPAELVKKIGGDAVLPSEGKAMNGIDAYELEKVAAMLKLQVWNGSNQQSPLPNFRMAHMGEGLIVFSPVKDVFHPVKDRDLINEACNRLFDFKATQQQMKWFQDAKFGMFIHWNQSSLSEQEISWERKAARPKDSGNKGYDNVTVDFDYDTLYRRFNPVKYDPKLWMSIAEKSGMEYAVLTTKHHDGFSMFPSAYDSYTIAKTPYKKDIVGMFSKAVHDAGLKLGYYYSVRDWFHPYYLTKYQYRYLEYYMGELSELLTRYGKVDVLWFDSIGNSSLNDWDIRTTMRRIKQYQPDILINDRFAAVRSGGEQKIEDLKGDFNTPECKLGEFDNKKPWESCMTVANVPNSGWTGSWSYSSKAKIVPIEKSIMYLVNNTVKDGNLLYNIGPTPQGTFDPDQAKVFLAMGEWLKTYGEAIYGTRGGPYINQDWGGSCYKKHPRRDMTIIYLHVCPLMAKKGKALKDDEPLYIDVQGQDLFDVATVIDDGKYNGQNAKIEKEGDKYKITLPKGMKWNKIDTVIKLWK